MPFNSVLAVVSVPLAVVSVPFSVSSVVIRVLAVVSWPWIESRAVLAVRMFSAAALAVL